MNIKYSTSEMGFEGYFHHSHSNLRVFETQLLFLEAYHLPIQKALKNNYEGDLLYNIGKGGFEKPYILHLYQNHHNVISELKQNFEKVYIYQDGEIGWWNHVDVKLQIWWFNQLKESDGILVPNSTDVPFYKGLFPNKKIKVIRSVMTDKGLDKAKFKPKQNKAIITGPLTPIYNGFPQVLLAHNLEMDGIDIPPMSEGNMPKDSWDLADNLGVSYLEYMSWVDWMYNLNKYKVGYMLSAATASGSFALNCAYLGIPCIGDKRADTQRILFPDLAIDTFDNQKALELTLKLKNDLDFYNKISTKSIEMYNQEFTKSKMLKILNDE